MQKRSKASQEIQKIIASVLAGALVPRSLLLDSREPRSILIRPPIE